MNQKQGNIVLVEGLNELNVQLVPIAPPGVVIDFPDLSILDVEGIPFSDVTIEQVNYDAESVKRLAACLQEKYSYIGEYAPGGVGIRNPGATAQHVGPCPWIRGVNLNTVVIELTARLVAAFDEHPEWLYPFELEPSPYTGNIRYKDNAYAWASGCAAAWYPDAWGGPLPTGVLTATLAEPIVVGQIRGVRLTVQGKEPIAKYFAVGHQVLTENYLWLKPQFAAPMPPPAFRGGGSIQAELERDQYGNVIAVTFIPCEITANGRFAAGYYYPGVYDGVVSVSWYSSYYGREYATTYSFMIKNLMRVTGEGVVQ